MSSLSQHTQNLNRSSETQLVFSHSSLQNNLLYCPSGIDLQTLAEWSSSPISHQFDVVSPSHIWVFAHVTQGQDPWVISFSSYLRQEHLPKHCPTALNYAWMFAYTRIQLLSPQVDIKYVTSGFGFLLLVCPDNCVCLSLCVEAFTIGRLPEIVGCLCDCWQYVLLLWSKDLVPNDINKIYLTSHGVNNMIRQLEHSS